MKTITKTGLLLFTLSLAFGCAVSISSKQCQPAMATPSFIKNPSFVNDYSNSNGQNWQSNNDPSDGQSSDPTTYRNALKSTTPGFTQFSVFDITTKESTSVSDPSYIQAKSSSTDDFLAQYIPAHMEFVVSGYSKVTYSLTFYVSAYRSRTGENEGTRADYSTEFFWYDDTPQTPTTWFYHSNDFTSSTERGYSVYRVAGEVPGDNTIEYSITKTFTLENKNSSETTMRKYFGMFCYVESSGKVGTFTGELSVHSSTKEVAYAVARVNGQQYYTGASAIAAYNSADSSTMALISDVDLSASNYTLSSAGGTIDLVNDTIDLGSGYLSIGANTTITSSYTGRITSSGAYATIAINAEATLTLSGDAIIENTSTTSTARAVLLGHSKAKIYVGDDNRVTSNYYGVQVDSGYLYCSGRIVSNNSSYAIYIGSADSYKYIFLYGSNVQVSKVRINNSNLNKVRFSATSTTSSTGTSYSSSNIVNIELSSVNVSDIIVRNVNDSNYNKFNLISAPGYVLNRSSNNLYVAYQQYSITYTLSGMTTDGAATCTIENDLSFTLTPNSGYYLPNNIQVRVGSTTLTVNTHYTYNSTTGEVVIYKENINGNITVTANVTIKHNVHFVGPDGNEVLDPILVTNNYEYVFVAPGSMPDYYHVEWYENAERTGSVYYAGNSKKITSDITFYATYAQFTTEMCNEFAYAYMHMDDYNSELGYCKDSEHHYYSSAKDYFENHLNKTARIKVKNDYVNAYNRFCAWARANGEEVVQNLSGDYIVQESYQFAVQQDNSNDNLVVIIAVIAVATSLTLTMLVIKKRRSVK